jgi:hypothetical protein
MADTTAADRLFSGDFDDVFAVGAEPGNSAYFGRDVLRGLIDGVDDFVHRRQERWRRHDEVYPALLGSAMWLDDDELINLLAELEAGCIVITKQGRKPHELKKLRRLADLNERGCGLLNTAVPGLREVAPRNHGKPAIVGPSSAMYEDVIPMFRSLGFRKRSDLPPIIHAKLALLGHIEWYVLDAPGAPEVCTFSASRLWISSANFTASSRRSLEFGYWTEDPALVAGAERFLAKLIGSSEPLDPDSDSFDPELAPVEYDDDAMREAFAEEMAHADERADGGYGAEYWDGPGIPEPEITPENLR